MNKDLSYAQKSHHHNIGKQRSSIGKQKILFRLSFTNIYHKYNGKSTFRQPAARMSEAVAKRWAAKTVYCYSSTYPSFPDTRQRISMLHINVFPSHVPTFQKLSGVKSDKFNTLTDLKSSEVHNLGFLISDMTCTQMYTQCIPNRRELHAGTA